MATAPSFCGTFVFGPTCSGPSFLAPVLDLRPTSQKVRAKVRQAALNSSTLGEAVCLFDRSGATMSPTAWEELIGEAACLLVDDCCRMTDKLSKTRDERDVYLVERNDLKREVVELQKKYDEGGRELTQAWNIANQRCNERDDARRAAGAAQGEIERLRRRVDGLKQERDSACNHVVDTRAENTRLRERVKQLEEVTCKTCLEISAENDRLKSVANEAVNHRQDAIARKSYVEQELIHAHGRLRSVTTLLGAMNYNVDFNLMDGVTITRR
jgi:hypothetical protein